MKINNLCDFPYYKIYGILVNKNRLFIVFPGYHTGDDWTTIDWTTIDLNIA